MQFELLFTIYGTSDKLLNHLVHQLPHLLNGDYQSSDLVSYPEDAYTYKALKPLPASSKGPVNGSYSYHCSISIIVYYCLTIISKNF